MSEYPIIFEAIFGDKWQQLPPVFKRHYANRAYTQDKFTVKGTITIHNKGIMKWFGPLMGWLRTLPPYAADHVPITVDYVSSADSNAFHMQRIFYYPNKAAFVFNSKMIPLHDNLLVELTQAYVGWKMAYEYDGEMIKLVHQGFVLKFFKWFIPLPVEWVIGKCQSYEVAISDDEFRMNMQFTHPWFGVLYEYYGNFRFH